eukprot:6897588-Heterocapsa_arctica.AAC.1
MMHDMVLRGFKKAGNLARVWGIPSILRKLGVGQGLIVSHALTTRSGIRTPRDSVSLKAWFPKPLRHRT